MQNTNNLNSETRETRCGECGERLGDEAVTDEIVLDFDGTLDYISLFHERCHPDADEACEADGAHNAGRTVGGVEVTHRGNCDGTHTGFASPCNSNVLARRIIAEAQACLICGEPMDVDRSGSHAACREEMEGVDDKLLRYAR